MFMTLFCLCVLCATHLSLLTHAIRVADDLAAILNTVGLAALCYVIATL